MAKRPSSIRTDPIPCNATITDAVKDDAVFYQIEVEMSCGDAKAEWVLKKRYSEFEALKQVIEKAGVTVKGFPEKKMFGSDNDETIEERKVQNCGLCEAHVRWNSVGIRVTLGNTG